MCETMPELNFDFLMNGDQLELPDIDLGMGFDEMIPTLGEETSPDLELAADFLFFPETQANYKPMPFSEELLLGSANSFYFEQPEQTDQLSWETHGVPSATTSPVQMDSLHLNTIPTGYEHQQFYATEFVNCRKRKASSQQCEANMKNENKPKRKRVQNARQRSAANVRERKRMVQLNDAFDSLKARVPAFSDEKRLSRMETLKLAMTYISFMTQLLDGKKTDEVCPRDDGVESFSLIDLEQLKYPLSPSHGSEDTESFVSSSS